MRSWKLSSTPHSYEQAVLEGAEKVSEGSAAQLIHSSTVATNALLEKKGARCALITTSGFRDVLEIGRQNRPELYALCPKLPEPVIPRERRFEWKERVNANGQIETPLCEKTFSGILKKLKAANVEAVAVVFLFSFLNPTHERRVGEWLRENGFRVSLSHEILPEFREYERSSTTAINAYVQPAMSDYLERLQGLALKQNLEELQIVQSNGGTLSPEQAGERAVNTLLSGPAAGLQGAIKVFKASDNVQNLKLITFDMGGTSTDVSLIDGALGLTTELALENYPVGVPMVDVHTVGAGGGSIAKVDSGGALQVGPASAGASPGPAAYGGGGPATVTDAHVILKNLRPEYFLQGRMRLDESSSWSVFKRLAEDMGGIPIEEAAQGVLRLVNLHMENAIRTISVQRGHDPADFVLMGFGGAGGLHVFALADALNIPKVMVPCHPGVLSALGAASACLRQEVSRTLMVPLVAEGFREIESCLPDLQAELHKRMNRKKDVHLKIFLDMRYRGQSHELRVQVDMSSLEEIDGKFRELYGLRFGEAETHGQLEVVTVRLQGEGDPPDCAIPELGPRPEGLPIPQAEDGVYLRKDLFRGDVISGPALILEDFHSVVLPAGWQVMPDIIGNLIGTRTGDNAS